MAYDKEKLAKLGALEELAKRVNEDYATKTEVIEIKQRVDDIITQGGEPNAIDKIKVNGTEQTIDEDKAVDITVPTKVSELTNDSGFQTEKEMNDSVATAINEFATNVSDDGVRNTFKELVDYAAEHEGEAATFAGDIAKNKSNIEELQRNVAGKVDSVEGKCLSSNDYTTEEKEKLAGIDFATDAEVTEMLNTVFGVA